MENNIKLKLIEGLSKMEEGEALREVLEEFILETCNVSNIPESILNGDEKILAIEVKGRKVAKEYIDILYKSLKLNKQKEVVKKLYR